jgi:hypothetical protein
MSDPHAPGPDPAPPKKPQSRDKPGGVYGGTWSPPESPQRDPGTGSAPRAPKPKGEGQPQPEPQSFDPDSPGTALHAGGGVSCRMPRASAWWSPPEMGEHV